VICHTDGVSTTPGRGIRRRRLSVAGIIAFVVVLYATVVILYANSGQVEITDPGETGPTTAVVRITPERVDAAADRMTFSLLPLPTGPLAGDDEALTAGRDFVVLVNAPDGTRTFEFEAGQVLAPTEVTLATEGSIEEWPFDRYTLAPVAIAVGVDADGDGDAEAVPTLLVGDGSVTGWNIVATGLPVDDEVDAVAFTATRSGSTVAFGIVLLSLMVVMPVLVLTVSISVYRGRRKVEATLMSWIGAMLFATIPLRNFLPGNPPIGSWVDYLIVLWVIAGLVVGLIVYVAAWLRLGPDGPARSAPTADGPVASAPTGVSAPPRS